MSIANHREVRSDASEQRFWGTLAVLAFSVVLVASVVWNIGHPYPQGWDETQYINVAHRDISSVRHTGIVGIIKSLLRLDPARPPGFRLVALPVTLLFGASPTILRLLSVLSLGACLLLVYLTAKRIAGPSSGAFATIFLGSSLAVVYASKNFGTEYALYLAISMMLYCLFRAWNIPRPATWEWVGLGLALGFGAWAKTSFFLIAAPLMTLVLLLSSTKAIAGPSPNFLIKAAGLGILIAAPWWLLNFRGALGFAEFSRNFVRQSLGPPSLETYVKWVTQFATAAIGLPLALLVLLLLLSTLLRKLVHLGGELDRVQILAIWVCLAGGLPLVFAQVMGINHNMRLITPSFIPLALVFGTLAQRTAWTRNRWLQIGAGTLLFLQLFVVASGLTKHLFNRNLDEEQWDWEPLRRICEVYHIQNPLIAHLGVGGSFSPPQIAYPWFVADEPVRVEWLWRYEQGKIDWQKVEDSINSSDVVLTAPDFIVAAPQYAADPKYKGNLDNQHNAELAQRMEANSRFMKPIRLKMGRYTQVEVLVFVRKPIVGSGNSGMPIPEILARYVRTDRISSRLEQPMDF